MKIRWIRGNDRISYHRPSTWFALGIRGCGKSSLLEHIGENYLEKGHTVLDLFGSRDGEGLAWLRSPYAEEKKILLVHGENVEVETEHDTKTVDQVKMLDFIRYDIIISSSPLYHSTDDEFYQSAKLTDKIYNRKSWSKLCYAIVREAGNFYYSRLKVSENQVIAKAQMIYLIREARHVGLAMGLDTLRFYSIDIDIRSISDFVFIKSLGLAGLPSDLHWLYSYVEPHLFRHLSPDEFVIITKKGCIGYGVFPEVPWHKQEKENIIKKVGLDITYKEPVKKGENRGTFKTIGDREHAKIIELYNKGLSNNKIADKLGRSTRTIWIHIKTHNYQVQTLGLCPRCKRAESPYFDKQALR